MDNIFFSVIMPNYNNEKYLDKSINSILKQDFKNFEFIFIDDLSTDNSVEKAKKICKNYSNTHIIIPNHKVWNGGGRNIGAAAAKGQYLIFLDSDDWFADTHFFSALYNHIINNNYPDLIRLTFDLLTNTNEILHIPLQEKTIKELVDSCFVACWTKVLKREKFIPFPENTLMEDVVQHIAICDIISNFTILDDIVSVIYNKQNVNSCSAQENEHLQNGKWKSSMFRYYADLYDLRLTHDYCEDHRQRRLKDAKANIDAGLSIQ